eukprot:102138-Pleurochrysis_carterae.AAC.2
MFSSGHPAARSAQARPMRRECQEYTRAEEVPKPQVEDRVRVRPPASVGEEGRCSRSLCAAAGVGCLESAQRYGGERGVHDPGEVRFGSCGCEVDNVFGAQLEEVIGLGVDHNASGDAIGDVSTHKVGELVGRFDRF